MVNIACEESVTLFSIFLKLLYIKLKNNYRLKF
jgi:hypothetical protein